MRGAAPMNVGLTTPVFSTILSTRPSIALAKPHASLGGDQHLAEGVRQRQPQQLQIVLAQQAHVGDHAAGVHPGLMAQPHAFRLAGGSRGVDQRRQLLGVDLLGDRAHAGGMLGQILRALVGEVVQGDHPVAVRGSVEHHDLGQVGQVAASLGELLELGVVLGEDDLRVGVGEDVGGVFGVRAGVDGGRCRAGAQDRQVGQDPLEPSGSRRYRSDPRLRRRATAARLPTPRPVRPPASR